jgi:2-phospho-L-lactate/phosphoenolpyruvate guanylyltransferase
LSVLTAWDSAARVHLVTADPMLKRLARASTTGVNIVADVPDTDLNAALRSGRERALRSGATAVLYLPADLPLLTADSLDGLVEAADAAIAAGSGKPVVVIAPADARSGTNALLVSPPETIDPRFGEDSLAAHLRAAASADASLQLVSDPALSFDLDTPEDLERLEAGRLFEFQASGQDALDALAQGMARAEVA